MLHQRVEDEGLGDFGISVGLSECRYGRQPLSAEPLDITDVVSLHDRLKAAAPAESGVDDLRPVAFGEREVTAAHRSGVQDESDKTEISDGAPEEFLLPASAHHRRLRVLLPR